MAGRLQRLHMMSALFVLCRACFSVALITDDFTSRRHQSPGQRRSSDFLDDEDVGGFNVDGMDRGREQSRRADPRQVRWATAAHEYVLRVNCRRNMFATERECSEIQRIYRAHWNVYLADPQLQSGTGRRRNLRTVLPDGRLGDSGRHHHVDGVVVLDPYPDANFGHLVLVFHVTIAASASWCQRRHGSLIGNTTSISGHWLTPSPCCAIEQRLNTERLIVIKMIIKTVLRVNYIIIIIIVVVVVVVFIIIIYINRYFCYFFSLPSSCLLILRQIG